MMFERFTDRARTTIQAAVAEAADLGDTYVGTEHLLLAMLASDGGVAYQVLTSAGLTADGARADVKRFKGHDAEALESIGIDLDAVKAKIEESFGPGALDDLEPSPKRGWLGRMFKDHRPFTPRAKKVLELSLRETLALHHKEITTAHLLLALLREGRGLAAKVLADAGLDFAHLREQTIRAIPVK